MKTALCTWFFAVVVPVACGFLGSALAAPPGEFTWTTVVNNNDRMPQAPGTTTFNSYNQPSVNRNGLVVFRARSRGGAGQGGPVHGIYRREMAAPGSPITRILDRTTPVPAPANLATRFRETPAFPRIDLASDTVVTRGNHPPVWQDSSGTPESGEESETRLGTSGVYLQLGGELLTGASRLGSIEEFAVFQVPGQPAGTAFDVFPGAPAVTDGRIIVFKGNYTASGTAGTGVFYRSLQQQPAGGDAPTTLIANTATPIPGSSTYFGSLSPPSAARQRAVFAGYDNEQAPTAGGLYLAPLREQPPLVAIRSIGDPVPEQRPATGFLSFGEAVAFDGRFAGFWGSWGEERQTLRLDCPSEGNRDRIAYCRQQLVCADTGELQGDPNSSCDETGCYQELEVPVHQGFFVHDTATGQTRVVAKTGDGFDDFLFWTYSGAVPCRGGGDSEEATEEDGEFVRWRASAFISVATRAGVTYIAVFKARSGELTDGVYAEPVDGIYLRTGPGTGLPVVTLLDTTTDGQRLDPQAPAGSVITELGLEREGLRGHWLVINASMGVAGSTEDEGLAGIYLTTIPPVGR